MNGFAAALLFALTAQTPASAPHEATPVTVGGTHFRGAFELSAASFPSGTAGGSQDLFVSGAPMLSLDGGADFGFELGAQLRLRVFDDPPEQRARDYGNVLRREDWDQLSDYGQILRSLRLGSDASPVQFRAGSFASFTLGNGELIARYANQLNPNYHPAGANLVMYIGATRTELFASDVLGGRLFAGEIAVDMARAFGARPETHDRYHLALQVAQDFGRAGGTAPPLTLGWLEFDAALLRAPRVQITAYVGLGGRAFDDGSSLGAALGVSAEGQPDGARVGGRLEIRKQNSGFRPGMIGFDYELARFSAIGLYRTPLADERLTDSFSIFGEFSTAIGDSGLVGTAAAEYFNFGRTNLDVSLQSRAFDDRAALGGRVSVVGIGETPRYLGTIEGRIRFLPSLYAVGSGGTVFFPQPDGGLARGVFVGIGIGADFERS